MGWVSWPLYIFVLLAFFSALWWPNIWLKRGFPELFEKSIGSIHFIPGIYPYGVNLLSLIHFWVPSPIFGPLVAKYLAENGVSKTFQNKISTQFISYMAFTLMGWVWNKSFPKNRHLCGTRLKNRNLYWIFLDEVGSDLSGGILSPFMGTACFHWRKCIWKCCLPKWRSFCPGGDELSYHGERKPLQYFVNNKSDGCVAVNVPSGLTSGTDRSDAVDSDLERFFQGQAWVKHRFGKSRHK